MKKLILIATLILVFNFGYRIEIYAQSKTLYGTIVSSESGDALACCNVYLTDKTKGTTTNKYGYYSFELPDAINYVVFSYIGYINDTVFCHLTNDSVLNIKLQPNNSELKSINYEGKRNSAVSTYKLKTTEVKSMPMAMGEPDLIKGLQLLPGVLTTTEGTTNLSIRGGTKDQNLILIDEAPVYNPSHVLALVSAFNIDAIEDVTLFKGYIPASYGGRLSSIIDIRMKEGNNEKFAVSGGIGAISSRLTLEMPIIKGETSFLISGRYGYPGNTLNGFNNLRHNPHFSNLLTIPVLKNLPEDNIAWFYDFNFKLKHIINSKNKIFLSAYTSKDEFEYRPLLASNSNMKWGNTTITARWNHIQNSKMFINYTLLHSDYNYSYLKLKSSNAYLWTSGLKETSFKTDVDYFINSNNHLKFGTNISYNIYLPGKIGKTDQDSNFNEFSLHQQQTLKMDFYISDKYKFSKNLDLNFGIRYSSLMNLGADEILNYNDDMSFITDTTYYSKGEIIKYHFGFEPRLSLEYRFNSNQNIEISYIRTKQYVHLMSNSVIGLPTDVWLPSNSYIEPSNSNQYSLGYFQAFKKLKINTSAEIYYRHSNNIVDFVDNADLFLNNQIEKQLAIGESKSYGLELMLKKETGKFNGWISYTLSKTVQRVDGVNENNWYPAYYDKRHNLAVFLNYKLSKSFEISSVFKFSSGANVTVPVQSYSYQNDVYIEYSDRNAYKLPNYHRLDLSLRYMGKRSQVRRWKNIWELGVYNIYNRKNIFAIESGYNVNVNQLTTSKVYLYGIVPYLSYQFKF